MMESNGVRADNGMKWTRLCGRYAWLVVLAIFWTCVLRNADLPGLYMDAINPDYLVARWLNPSMGNHVWVFPGPHLPLLGNLYHGTQTMWLGLLMYGVLGTSVFSALASHALWGAAIVLLTGVILRRGGCGIWLAWAVAAGLATDMAFLGSFRTQAFIILSGQAWMMAALYSALRSVRAEASDRRWQTLGGICMGLAVYGYFVFLFFLPVVAGLAIFGRGRIGSVRRACLWGGGFVIGMLPYVAGYAWMAVDLGGWVPFVDWMRNALDGLKPTGASPDYWTGLASALGNARLGLSGSGNELMMVGEDVSSGFSLPRVLFFAASTAICACASVAGWKRDRAGSRFLLATAALPVSYLLCAGFFGARMWAHHFTVLVAVEYLSMGMAAYWLAWCLPKGWGARVVVGGVATLLLLCINVIQQDRVQARLVATGGTGMSTDALPALARAALSEKNEAVWYFPDWGFFMPFAFLTGNQVAYELELSPAALGRHRGTRNGVRLAFWKPEDRLRYEKALQDGGVHDIRFFTMRRRDGADALYVLTGTQAPDAGSRHDGTSAP